MYSTALASALDPSSKEYRTVVHPKTHGFTGYGTGRLKRCKVRQPSLARQSSREPGKLEPMSTALVVPYTSRMLSIVGERERARCNKQIILNDSLTWFGLKIL